MGRLDDIAERNQRENRRSTQRVWFAAAIVALVVISVVLAVYTDLGTPAPVDRSHAYGVELRQK